MLRKYWNVTSVNGLEKWNSDAEEVSECSKCERTREKKQDVKEVVESSKCERTREMKQRYYSSIGM